MYAHPWQPRDWHQEVVVMMMMINICIFSEVCVNFDERVWDEILLSLTSVYVNSSCYFWSQGSFLCWV